MAAARGLQLLLFKEKKAKGDAKFWLID